MLRGVEEERDTKKKDTERWWGRDGERDGEKQARPGCADATRQGQQKHSEVRGQHENLIDLIVNMPKVPSSKQLTVAPQVRFPITNDN